jgi:hypothetical protein
MAQLAGKYRDAARDPARAALLDGLNQRILEQRFEPREAMTGPVQAASPLQAVEIPLCNAVAHGARKKTAAA